MNRVTASVLASFTLTLACGGDVQTVPIQLDGGAGADAPSAVDSGPPVDLDGALPPPGDGSSAGDAIVATDGSVGPDAAAFNPANLSGLVLWLDAAKGVTQKSVNNATRVVSWADQTSHKNDAAGSQQQQTFGQNPTAVASSINGLPAVHFDKGAQQGAGGNILTILDNADTSLHWGTGDFYLVVVGLYDNSSADGLLRGVGTFFSKNFANGQNTFTGVSLYGNIPGNNFNASAGMYFQTENTTTNFVATLTANNNAKPHLFALQRAANKLDMRIDGASVATATSAGVSVDAKNTQVRIGAEPSNGFLVARLNGDIAEMLAVKGALSPSDTTSLEAYLKAKYAL